MIFQPFDLRTVALVFVAFSSFAARDFATTPDLLHDEAAWTQLAHAIFNTQEFIHYR